MSTPLATRCPACSTVFRVVPDQLRVSEGWVRCGRCAEVFDATESLVDLDTGAPRRWDGEKLKRPAPPAATGATPPPAPAAPAAPTAAAPARDDERAERYPPEAAPDLAGAGLAPLAAPEPVPAPPAAAPDPDLETPAAVAAARSAADDAAWASGTPREIAATGVPASTTAETPADGTSDPAIDLRAEPAELPSFVRRAERAQRWQRPPVRAALAALALLALLGLASQVAYSYRDLAAARFPQARPALEQACALLGCRVEAARAIDALAVESSGLVRVEKSSVYQLSVALRNQAGIDVALPALDLTLTDTQGRLIARKVLLPADLGATPATIGAGRERALQATLQAALPASEPVAGYTIELFYP